MCRYIFSSESVGRGHPDKVADSISDAILDDILSQDPNAHVACETLVNTGMVVVSGEISTTAYADIPAIVRKVVTDIGYDSSEIGFDGNTCAVICSIDKQSPDIDQGVSRTDPEEQGAGDQGMCFGYATDETPNLMPAPIYYAHALTRKLEEVRKSMKVAFFRPDCKSQVSIEYSDDVPVSVKDIVIAIQHSPNVSQETVRNAVIEYVIKPVFADCSYFDIDKCKIFVNGTGKFVIGGPVGDCGLTGRKIINDTYGGFGSHGGGAFSGKDPSKVDRSGAYMARYIAKNVVASGVAKRCQVQLAYCIGQADPISIFVTSQGTSNYNDEELTEAVKLLFNCKPYHIIKDLNLKRPIYSKTTNYGHFGKEGEEFTWERTDKASALKEYLEANP